MTHDHRFIEETFPVREVSEHSAREKNIRHGHISTLHIWWARRPLASSRATAYAALVPPPATTEEWQKQRQFVIDLSRWENSLNPHILEKARRDIYRAHAERVGTNGRSPGRPVTVEDIEAGRVPPPRVLDPFAGGGAIPLEALRLGCEAYANDYNPVAVLILKATLEYPQKYGRPFEGMPTDLLPGRKGLLGDQDLQQGLGLEAPPDAQAVPKDFNPLLAAVRQWGNWVLERARKELAAFYRSPDPDETVVGYIWARTLPCQNPSCGAEIPLMRQFWLARKKDREIALHPVVRAGRVDFEIVARGKRVGAQGLAPGASYAPWPTGFDPKQGTVSRAVVTCPVCGAVMDAKTTRRLFRTVGTNGRSPAGQRMVAVVTTRRGQRGKFYRLPTPADLDTYAAAEQALVGARRRLAQEWGMEPVPNEPTPEGKGSGAERAFSVRNYGLDTWGDLFNARQQLALITFAEKVRQAHAAMLAQGYPEDFARAVATYLSLVLSRHSSYNATLCWWEPLGERSFNVFGRQALPMVFDYSEQVPFGPLTGNWRLQTEITCGIINHLSLIPHPSPLTPRVSHASATRLPYPDDHFDAVLTDPPYYDNVPYAYLSDFFYVWLKRTVGHLYPDLFATPLTPKGEEIVAYSHGQGGLEEGKQRFETLLAQAFREIHRVLKPGGIAVIVYAYKTTAGWETVINALLESGLVVSGAWPLSTEMRSRLRANESAALASSIYIVARKMERQPTGFYNEVREELRRHLDRKLQRLWEEGIGGADFFIAAIGSAIEVFGKYEKIIDYEGHLIRGDRLLEEVRVLATDFAVHQILHNGFAGEIDPLTRLYVLWRWNFGEARAPFDEARKLAQSCGIDLAQEWHRRGTFIKKERQFVRVLGPHRRRMEDIAVGATGRSPSLIDTLHRALRHWEAGEQEPMLQLLADTGYGQNEAFWRVAQAISETLPITSKEKKLLDGFLAGRERVRRAVRASRQQGRLFDLDE